MFQTLMLISLFTITNGNYGPPLPPETVKIQEFVQKRSFVLQNPLSSFEAAEIAVSTINAGAESKIDPLVILALIEIESRYNPKAKSKKKCLGLTQMATTTAKAVAKKLGVLKYDLFKINDSIRLGVGFLKENLKLGRPLEVSFDIYNRGIGNWTKKPKISGYGWATKKRYNYLKLLYKKENDLTCTKSLTNQ